MAPLRCLLNAFLCGTALMAQTAPLAAVRGLKAADGLQVTLWAAEPLVVNPTNMDIDERGRVWYLEAVNYRRQLKNLPDLRKEGDRIVILEDTDGDGRADKRKVFHQDPSLRSPLGIAVLGNRVFLSQSPDLIVYTKDENDNIVSREIVQTGFKGADHDHGLHAVVFGPDGHLYFNAGDQGFDLTTRDGRRLASCRTCEYFAGTVWRMDRGGANLTVLAHNFRNPYELSLDSFGNIWQSDNDDDGNAWTRLNFVMPGGNYGYWGPGGRRWQEDRGTHFHQELPGVVPNILRLGAGSPCGLLVYEGNLLPERYRGKLIHAEAGKRSIRVYSPAANGAGFEAGVHDLVTTDDTWFRPADVTVHPDGSVFIADWYDPGVGGHNMGDTRRGRIYRIAPRGHKPAVPAPSLESPNQSARYLAWTAPDARESAAALWRSSDAILRARAFWLLKDDPAVLAEAAASGDERFRILALRGGFPPEKLRNDPSAQVQRELALRGVFPDPMPDGLLNDRWYLEALGIGARGREEELTRGNRHPRLLWRLRPPSALPALLSRAAEPGVLEVLAAYAQPEAALAVARLAAGGNEEALGILSKRLFSEWAEQRGAPEVAAAIRAGFRSPGLRAAAIELADALEDPQFTPDLIGLARAPDAEPAAILAAGRTRAPEALPVLESLLKSPNEATRIAAVRGLAAHRPGNLETTLRALVLGKDTNAVRGEALRMLARTDTGLSAILDLEQRQELPAEFRTLATNLANASRNPALQARARKLLPPVTTRANTRLADARFLARQEGDAAKGKLVFNAKTGADCASCHALAPGKSSVGPNLSDIGTKLGKEALLDAILNPSAGIAHEYVAWVLDTKTQGQVIGILAEDTPQRIVVRTETGDEIRLRPADVTARRQSKLSLMPEDLVTRMTERELIDLVEYLTTLRQPAAAAAR
jgi:putative membrane-bound dehydrogenase-like protein